MFNSEDIVYVSHKKPAGIILVPGVFFVVGLYLAGLLAQIIYRASNPSWVFQPVTLNNFAWGLGMWGVAAIIAAITFAVYIQKHRMAPLQFENRELRWDPSGAYGSQRTATWRDVQKVLDRENPATTKNLILGLSRTGEAITYNPTNDVVLRMASLAICGRTGSGKNFSVIENLLYQIIRNGESAIVCDLKGENYNETVTVALKSEYNYEIRVLNLQNPELSDGFDIMTIFQYPFGDHVTIAQFIATIIVENTKAEDRTIWPRYAKELIEACILRVADGGAIRGENDPAEAKSLAAVYRLLSRPSGEMLAIINDLGKDHPASTTAASYDSPDKKVILESAQKTASDMLASLKAKPISRIFSRDDLSLSRPGEKPCLYYLIPPIGVNTYDWAMAMYFSAASFVLTQAVAGKTRKKRLPVRVNLVMDEMPNIGRIPKLASMMNIFRSYNIRAFILYQNAPGLMNRYPDNEWKSILDCCSIQIFFGSNDPETNKFSSDQCGKGTAKVYRGGILSRLFGPSDYDIMARPVFTPDEFERIGLMGNDETDEVIYIGGTYPYYCRRFPKTMHPSFADVREMDVNKYIPVEIRQTFAESAPTVKRILRRAERDGRDAWPKGTKALIKAVIYYIEHGITPAGLPKDSTEHAVYAFLQFDPAEICGYLNHDRTATFAADFPEEYARASQIEQELFTQQVIAARQAVSKAYRTLD